MQHKNKTSLIQKFVDLHGNSNSNSSLKRPSEAACRVKHTKFLQMSLYSASFQLHLLFHALAYRTACRSGSLPNPSSQREPGQHHHADYARVKRCRSTRQAGINGAKATDRDKFNVALLTISLRLVPPRRTAPKRHKPPPPPLTSAISSSSAAQRLANLLQCDAGGGSARPWAEREPGALGSRRNRPSRQPTALSTALPPPPPRRLPQPSVPGPAGPPPPPPYAPLPSAGRGTPRIPTAVLLPGQAAAAGPRGFKRPCGSRSPTPFWQGGGGRGQAASKQAHTHTDTHARAYTRSARSPSRPRAAAVPVVLRPHPPLAAYPTAAPAL